MSQLLSAIYNLIRQFSVGHARIHQFCSRLPYRGIYGFWRLGWRDSYHDSS